MHYIVDFKINIITANFKLRLASNDISPKTLEYFSFEVIQILQQNLAPFFVSILKTFASALEDCRVFWDKTPADLENNIEYHKQTLHNYINKFVADIIDRDKVMQLGDDISQTVDRSFLG